MLGFSALSGRPISGLFDVTLAAAVASPPVGQILNYTLEMFPSSGTRIAAAQSSFITLPTDSLSNQLFLGTLDVALHFTRTIVNGSGFGKASSNYGELQLNNAGGDYDAVYQNDTIDGRRVFLRYGWIDDNGIPSSYDNYQVLLDGIAQDWFLTDKILRVTLRGNSFKLDVPASPNVYVGTGGIDGTSDMAGKRKPRCYGSVSNATVPLIDPVNLVYQVHDGVVSSIPAVYDSGYALPTPGTVGPDADYANYTALIAATVASGHYVTCKAQGLFRLGSAAYGLITADVHGDASPTYVNDTASIVRRVIATSTAIDLVDEGVFIALAAQQPAEIGYFLGLDDSKTVRQVVDDLMTGIGGWCDFRRDGTLDCGILILPTGMPVETYTTVDVLKDALQRLELPDGINPPPKRQRVEWGRNWTTQTEVSAGVAADRMQLLKSGSSVAPSTDDALSATVAAAHLLAQDPDPVPAYFVNQADAEDEANRLLTLYSDGVRSLYSFKVKSKGLIHEIGQTIQLTYPRFDLSSGKLLSIVGLDDDTTEKSVTVTVFG